MPSEILVVDEKTYRSIVLDRHWNEFIEPLQGMPDPPSSWQAESKLRAKQDEVLWRLAMANPDDYVVGEDGEVTRK